MLTNKQFVGWIHTWILIPFYYIDDLMYKMCDDVSEDIFYRWPQPDFALPQSSQWTTTRFPPDTTYTCSLTATGSLGAMALYLPLSKDHLRHMWHQFSPSGKPCCQWRFVSRHDKRTHIESHSSCWPSAITGEQQWQCLWKWTLCQLKRYENVLIFHLTNYCILYWFWRVQRG